LFMLSPRLMIGSVCRCWQKLPLCLHLLRTAGRKVTSWDNSSRNCAGPAALRAAKCLQHFDGLTSAAGSLRLHSPMRLQWITCDADVAPTAVVTRSNREACAASPIGNSARSCARRQYVAIRRRRPRRAGNARPIAQSAFPARRSATSAHRARQNRRCRAPDPD